ncbi:MAG: hypothetical protein DWQ36_23835 [Acidobacteria bacterium]|nr:MAG: hypothetical protein DWQ30_07030 [Acidobacteriota bacterium]REK00185.1 MAG: hypothetical protein DWQ36_23835 [Acidobacteriota bacterium]
MAWPVGGLLVLLSVAASATAASADDEAAVRSVFERYRDALAAGEGAAAASLVDAETFDYLEELKRLARTAPREELSGRSFVDRLLVVTLRHTLDERQLQEITLAELIDLAMQAGWLAPETLGELTIGEVRVDGDAAMAQALTAQGLPLDSEGLEPLSYEFVREQGAWKFRFAALVDSLGRLVSGFTAQIGAEDDALIFMLVESFSGRAVVPEVWSPPEARPQQAPPPRR